MEFTLDKPADWASSAAAHNLPCTVIHLTHTPTDFDSTMPVPTSGWPATCASALTGLSPLKLPQSHHYLPLPCQHHHRPLCSMSPSNARPLTTVPLSMAVLVSAFPGARPGRRSSGSTSVTITLALLTPTGTVDVTSWEASVCQCFHHTICALMMVDNQPVL